ncbi:uncharacterized protein LOC132149178 isoform X1 [Carassius carassius]|uniref:uncharacterized protein LOC132149178 isoform X1 n=1 Tax=Carassius carassius TaxID=217509 RepID=UPI002868E44A|nr:uncharacterized protein LOC132149178 isoform X1 [Carassius carassius]
MCGKVWTLITAFSFITYIHDVQSGCMKNDIKAHLDDLLLEEHMFEVKEFSPETKERELLSIINSLCSVWSNNKLKDEKLLRVLETFRIMLHNLDHNFETLCTNLTCTEEYTVRHINTSTFGEMYKKSCGGSVSDLKCPSKSTTINPTTEYSSTFLTTVSLITTNNKTLTTVSPNITATENMTAVSSARTETIIQALKDDNRHLWAATKASSGLLVVSFLLNVVLLLMVVHVYEKKKNVFQREGPGGEENTMI